MCISKVLINNSHDPFAHNLRLEHAGFDSKHSFCNVLWHGTISIFFPNGTFSQSGSHIIVNDLTVFTKAIIYICVTLRGQIKSAACALYRIKHC